MALGIPTLAGLLTLTFLGGTVTATVQLHARRSCPRFDFGNTRDRRCPGLGDLLKPCGALGEHVGKGA